MSKTSSDDIFVLDGGYIGHEQQLKICDIFVCGNSNRLGSEVYILSPNGQKVKLYEKHDDLGLIIGTDKVGVISLNVLKDERVSLIGASSYTYKNFSRLGTKFLRYDNDDKSIYVLDLHKCRYGRTVYGGLRNDETNHLHAGFVPPSPTYHKEQYKIIKVYEGTPLDFFVKGHYATACGTSKDLMKECNGNPYWYHYYFEKKDDMTIGYLGGSVMSVCNGGFVAAYNSSSKGHIKVYQKKFAETFSMEDTVNLDEFLPNPPNKKTVGELRHLYTLPCYENNDDWVYLHFLADELSGTPVHYVCISDAQPTNNYVGIFHTFETAIEQVDELGKAFAMWPSVSTHFIDFQGHIKSPTFLSHKICGRCYKMTKAGDFYFVFRERVHVIQFVTRYDVTKQYKVYYELLASTDLENFITVASNDDSVNPLYYIDTEHTSAGAGYAYDICNHLISHAYYSNGKYTLFSGVSYCYITTDFTYLTYKELDNTERGVYGGYCTPTFYVDEFGLTDKCDFPLPGVYDYCLVKDPSTTEILKYFNKSSI